MQTNIGKKTMSVSLAAVLALSMTPAQAFAEGSQEDAAVVAAAQTETEEEYTSININGQTIQLKKKASAFIPENASKEEICEILWEAFLVNRDDYEYVAGSDFTDQWMMFTFGSYETFLGPLPCSGDWGSVYGFDHDFVKNHSHKSLASIPNGEYPVKIGVNGQELSFIKGMEFSIELTDEKEVVKPLNGADFAGYEALEKEIVTTLVADTNPKTGSYSVEYEYEEGKYASIAGISIGDYEVVPAMPLDGPHNLRITFKPSSESEYIESTVYVEGVTVVDSRESTSISVDNPTPTIVYCSDSSKAEESLREALGSIAVMDANENAIEGAKYKIDGDYSAGSQTFTISYAGDGTYQPATLEVNVTIEKAPVEVSVASQVVSTGTEIASRSLVTTGADAVSAIQFTVGLDASGATVEDGAISGAEGKVNLILPMVDDVDLADKVSEALEFVGIGSTFELSQIENIFGNAVVQGVLSLAGVSEESLDQFLSTMNMIEEQFGDLSVSITSEYPTEVGAYAVGGVTVDPNYETASGIGYLVIAPTAEEVSLEWKSDALSGGFVDDESASGVALGAKVADDSVESGLEESLASLVGNVVLGVNGEGDIVLLKNPEKADALSVGAYTELAYLLGFGEGNEVLYYAKPLMRAFVVAPSNVDVSFSEDGYTKTFDGEAVSVSVNVAGVDDPGDDLSVRYYGMQADGTPYDSDEAPVNAGVYTALATYIARDGQGVIEKAGAAVAPIVINRVKSEVAVGAESTYGELVDGLVKAEGLPGDSSQFETVDVTIGGTDENPIVYVNASDETLAGLIGASAGTADVAVVVDQIVAAIEKVQSGIPVYASVEGADSETVTSEDVNEAINKLKEELGKLPDTVTVSAGHPSDAGSYQAFGFAYSPNYVPSFGEGTLEIGKATLAVTAENLALLEGQNAELKYSYGTAVNGEVPGFSGGLAVEGYESESLSGLKSGEYEIVQGSLDLADNGSFKASNYEIDFTGATLTVEAVPEQGGDGDGETGGNTGEGDVEEGATVVNPDGSVTTTVTEEDGSSVATTVSEDGFVTTVVEKDSHGDVTHIEASVSASSPDVALGNVVELPMEPVEAVSSDDAVEIELSAPAGTKVSVPVAKVDGAEAVDYGAVLVMVDAQGNETVMPKTGVSEDGLELEVFGDCTLKVVDASVDFPDVDGSEWYAAYGVTDFVSARNILSGVVTADGVAEFQGDVQTTRAMFVTMLNRMELEPAASEEAPSFPDVSEGAWYEGTSAWAAEEGLLSGYVLPDGTTAFGGEDLVTREQIAVFLMRYADWLGLDTSARVESTAPDADSVSGWASEAVSWAVAEGYILGDEGTGTIRPSDGATRAEAATIIMRFVNSLY